MPNYKNHLLSYKVQNNRLQSDIFYFKSFEIKKKKKFQNHIVYRFKNHLQRAKSSKALK